MRHFLDLIDWTKLEIAELLTSARRMKADWGRGIRPLQLTGRLLGLVFEKPSLRTRVSFEAAMAHLGGQSIFLSATDGPIGKRESIPDFARTLSQFVDAVVLRVFFQKNGRDLRRACYRSGYQWPFRHQPPMPGFGGYSDPSGSFW